VNKWGRRSTAHDRYCCAGCDHFMPVNMNGEHLFPWGGILGPCKAKKLYAPGERFYTAFGDDPLGPFSAPVLSQ